MSRTFLCGKIGKSVKFNPSTWGATGGDNELPTLLRKIAELNPDDTFIVIGRNDIERNRAVMNIPTNLRDIYAGASPEEQRDVDYIAKRLEGVKIDGCFLMAGPVGVICNIPGKAFKRKELENGEKVPAKTLYVFEQYVGPIYQYLNTSGIPWVMICNDPRYIEPGSDLMNQPVKVLSQYDETVLMKTFDNFEDQNYIKNAVPSVYAGMEKIFLIDREVLTTKKTINFMMVLNEGNNGVKSRYPMLKEYVLDSMEDVAIYGKWDEKTIGQDPRFKGPVKFEELQKILPSVKYTFIIPIKKGWVTAKYVEMIASGIIPFFHPTYDEQRHCRVPEFIRINSPKELHEKIEYLNNNPNEYMRIFNECLACIEPGDCSGVKICTTVLENTPQVLGTGQNPFTQDETVNAPKTVMMDDEW
jgi:hypothetical protein